MAGYQTIEALRPILHVGPPATPVLDRALFYKPRFPNSPTYQQIKRMVELREQGVSLRAIAREIGCVNNTVLKYTRHVTPPADGWQKGGKPANWNREKALRMRRAGFTFKEIGEEFGCSESNAWLIVRDIHGKKGRGGGKPRPSRHYQDVVSRVTGIPVELLSKTGQRGGDRTVPGAARARVILFWIVRHRRPDLPYGMLARYLGGFDHTTCSNAYHRVSKVVEELQLKTTGKTENVVRRLWEAEWPKASA